MATSGTVGTTSFNVAKIIEHAYRRCRIPASHVTAEMLEIGRDSLYFYLSQLANKGISLWTVQRQILGQYQFKPTVTLPNGTVDVLNANSRTLSRVAGAPASSAGGDATFAFDGDLSTYCQQTSANGNVSLLLSSSAVPTSIGLMSQGSLSLTPVFEYSTDSGSTWATLFTPSPDSGSTSIAFTDGEWKWWDIDAPKSLNAIRVRETGGATMSLREFFVGDTPSAIAMSKLNRDDYSNLSNKNQTGRPLQFWNDRRLNGPVMHMWPVPDNNFDQIEVFYHRHIQDVGELTNTLEFPQRWIEALITNTAYRVALETPQVDPAIASTLYQLAEKADTEAAQEERDASPIFFTPAIAVYTR